MKKENEITIKINDSKEQIIDILLKNGYKKIDDYTLKDIYMIKKDIPINKDIFSNLKDYLLLRNINNNIYCLTYKNKKYDKLGNILNQEKINVYIDNINNSKTLLDKIGYKELINVYDKIEVYNKDNLDSLVEFVNNKYLYLEIEENEYYNLDDIKDKIDKLNINYDHHTFYANKAHDVFLDQY